MVNAEKIKGGRPEDLREALDELGKYSKEELIQIRKSLNGWNWHPLLGPEPEGWAEMPRYRKPWMQENTVTREDYLSNYSTLLNLLGITHWVAYDL